MHKGEYFLPQKREREIKRETRERESGLCKSRGEKNDRVVHIYPTRERESVTIAWEAVDWLSRRTTPPKTGTGVHGSSMNCKATQVMSLKVMIHINNAVKPFGAIPKLAYSQVATSSGIPRNE